ncbi:hypothetical protein [Streptomyces sp. UNOB3_S3]|uniref:hypothetical protein n=1 Tax=Streptomyces sp. UNOB3_S3 TaxID=2871682 RepID=UPI001E310E2B|nr:hypothetical protein [Streptomyces sp. UNOB3_S3]MCC3773378.1 hypothetical protein [Streptomyces sp. UNOB3_S3]
MDSQLNDVPGHSWLGAPIDARSSFAPEQAALTATLRGLASADWDAALARARVDGDRRPAEAVCQIVPIVH